MVCRENHFCPGGAVNATTVCPDGKYSLPGSDDVGDCNCPDNSVSRQNAKYVNECICDSGYYKEYSNMYALGGWYCRLCQVGEFCFNNTNKTCPDHSSSFGVARSYADCFCNAGYKNTTNRTEANFCEDCPANSFCTGKGLVQACTANAVAPVQSTSSLSCYCDWGWKGVNNSVCVACQSPTFCYGGVEAQCSEGTYSEPLSWTRLNCSCIPGRWGPTGGPCIMCGAGKYNLIPGCKACSNTSDVDCELCGLGTASTMMGRDTTCDVCGAGKFSFPANQRGAFTCENCADGTISGIGASNCTSCSDGYFAANGSSACTPCPAGTFATGLVGSCTACAAGKYSLGTATSCSECSAGKYGTMLGSPSPDNCQNCGYGTYNPVSGADDANDCLSCESGTYTAVNGTTNCSECGVGSFAETQASTCSLCSPGTFAPARASSCGVCPPGLYASPDSPACLSCPMGTYNDRNASENCSLCEAGLYSTGGTSGCLTCTYGTYSSGSGFWYCNECENGRFAGDGNSACTACFAGTWGVGRLETDENCSGCGAGLYSTVLGASSYAVCQACAAGKFSNETRAGQVSHPVFSMFLFIHRV